MCIAIARELHIPTVIVPLFPSHFSALGMLAADERHDFIRTYYSDLATLDFAELVKVYEEMHDGAQGQPAQHHAMPKSGSSSISAMSGRISRCRCRCRSRTSRKGDRKAIRTAFDKLYEHRYAHSSPEDPVEMVNMRLSVIGKRPTLKFPRLGKGRGSAITHRRDVYFADTRKPVRCPVYQREKLTAGTQHRRAGAGAGARHHHGAVPEGRVHGRAVRRTDHQGGRRVMAKARKQAALKRKPQVKRSAKRKALDPVTLEVIRNALPAVANEMAADLQRTSYNMMIYEVRDFCTALIDPDGKLVSQNVGGVSHFVADLGVIIVDGMQRYGAQGLQAGRRRSSPTTRRSPASTSTTSSSTRPISTRASC